MMHILLMLATNTVKHMAWHQARLSRKPFVNHLSPVTKLVVARIKAHERIN